MVRAPACHAGSCGFKSRLPRILFLVTLFTSVIVSCSGNQLDDLRDEGHSIEKKLIEELKLIRTRDDLLLHASELQRQFTALADVMIRAQKVKESRPDLQASVSEDSIADNLRLEMNRVLRLEGGRQVIEKSQEEALNKLDAHIKNR